VDHVVAPLALEWEPQLVLVSAGFDAHRADPLASCTVTEAGFAGMTATLRRVCDSLGVPMGLVLEGGYDLGALAASVAASMEALAGGGEPASFPRGPLVERAAGVLGRWWELSSPA
jgi:acetoin utilization deacetylase AcuC-like enzyme